MLACGALLLEIHVIRNDDYGRLRYIFVKHLALLYYELSHWRPGVSNRLVGELGRKHLTQYLELGRIHLNNREFQDTELVRYRRYPKHHLFIHNIEDEMSLEGGNPRERWCYGDEPFLGDMIEVAESVNAKVVHRSVITKFRL